MQNFVQNWPSCAELTKRHRNCNILQILFSNFVLSSALTAATCQHKEFLSKSNKRKQQQKIKKHIEMHTVHNYNIIRTKQVN